MAKQMIAYSITGVGGDVLDDLEIGLGEAPGSADVKGFGNVNVWDDEW